MSSVIFFSEFLPFLTEWHRDNEIVEADENESKELCLFLPF